MKSGRHAQEGAESCDHNVLFLWEGGIFFLQLRLVLFLCVVFVPVLV